MFWKDFYSLALLCLVTARFCTADVDLHPKTQKVLHGSPVVFTCTTTASGGTLEWRISNRQIEEKHSVRVEEISDVISVLRIENADIKRHKRLFTCIFNGPDGVVEKAETKLKVMQYQKLHKNFPHISSTVQTSDLGIPQPQPAKFDITCDLVDQTSTDLGVTWRWLKDDVTDVSYTEDFRNGRLQIVEEQNSATLRINRVSGPDSGTYVCVADNNRGNSYGTPIKVQIRTEQIDGCMTEEGNIITTGTTYNKGGDPCTTCECLDGGVLRCKSVGCVRPSRRTCRAGEVFRMSETTCCMFDCFPDNAEMPSNGCVTDNGTVPVGTSFKKDGDPCTDCECRPDGDILCRSVSCLPPRRDRSCPDGTEYRMSNTTCCKFDCFPTNAEKLSQGCMTDNGTVTVGTRFHKGGDPCTECECRPDGEVMCRAVRCERPSRDRPCPEGTEYRMSNVTCCKFDCFPVGGQEDTCTDRDSRRVARGELYMPIEDPCVMCQCDPGGRESCSTVVCARPTCRNFIPSRVKCCDYTCPPDLPTPPGPETLKRPCTDGNGQSVPDGEMFTVPRDPCMTCVCRDGKEEDCVTVICDEPPCRNYELIPGTCCGFRCPDDEGKITDVEVDLDGYCVGYGGEVVPDGEPYTPGPDPCVSCVCRKGQGGECRSIACRAPGPNCRKEPGTCCSWNCNDADNLQKVLGQLFVRQVGTTGALVQWKIPEGSEQLMQEGSDITTYVIRRGANQEVFVHNDTGRTRPYVILNNLSPNEDYAIVVNGTMGNGNSRKMLVTRDVPFSLNGRARPTLDLSDAMGPVFESRGSVYYETYSIPRKFEAVARSENVENYVNVDAFHRVEVSTYTETPCPNEECGMLRFFMYSLEGDSRNVMSLMFTNDQDFIWAKTHL